MKIFLDAGHNDKKWDTGAEGFGLREQDITFSITKLLGEKLKGVGFDIKYSRENKGDILGVSFNDSLNTRAKTANAFGADLFISVHCNSHQKESANGTEVYTYNTQSKAMPLAKNVQNKLAEALDSFDRGVKTASFAVLKYTDMPAILIETAFISNKADNEKLRNKQNDIAEAIFKAVCEEYGIKLKKYESAEEITDRLSKVIEIQDKETAIKQIQKAKEDNNSLYWILYKLANK